MPVVSATAAATTSLGAVAAYGLELGAQNLNHLSQLNQLNQLGQHNNVHGQLNQVNLSFGQSSSEMVLSMLDNLVGASGVSAHEPIYADYPAYHEPTTLTNPGQLTSTQLHQLQQHHQQQINNHQQHHQQQHLHNQRRQSILHQHQQQQQQQCRSQAMMNVSLEATTHTPGIIIELVGLLNEAKLRF